LAEDTLVDARFRKTQIGVYTFPSISNLFLNFTHHFAPQPNEKNLLPQAVKFFDRLETHNIRDYKFWTYDSQLMPARRSGSEGGTYDPMLHITKNTRDKLVILL